MRLESLSIFSLLVLVLSAVNNVCFASEGGFNSISSVSYVHDNKQRLAALTTYKKKISDSNKKIRKLKRLLSKIIQAQDDSYLSGLGFDTGFKTTRPSERRKESIGMSSAGKGGGSLSGMADDVELGKKVASVVVSLVEEQTRFMSLLLKRMIIFWNPSFNFGVDISSKGAIERGFLDMIGLGDKRTWSGSSYGGKLARATDSERREQESLEKLIDITEFYRYSMVYNYIQIIGPIYRHTKNFERTVRPRLRLFRNMRERLISSRDSLALMINTDLPDDIDLPYPVSPPCYLNLGENCNNDVYNQILNEVTFFKDVQDENKELSTRIREEPCENHESTGCTCCEIKKLRVSLIEWASSDVQADLLRLERDLKLCLDSIQQNSGKGGFPSGFGSLRRDGGASPSSPEADRPHDGYRDDFKSGGHGASGRSSEDGARRSTAGRPNRRGSSSGDDSDIKRYKKRSFLHKTSRRISKRRSLKSRRTRMGRRLKSLDTASKSMGDQEAQGPDRADDPPALCESQGSSPRSSSSSPTVVSPSKRGGPRASETVSTPSSSGLLENDQTDSEYESEYSSQESSPVNTPDHNSSCKNSQTAQCDASSPLPPSDSHRPRTPSQARR